MNNSILLLAITCLLTLNSSFAQNLNIIDTIYLDQNGQKEITTQSYLPTFQNLNQDIVGTESDSTINLNCSNLGSQNISIPLLNNLNLINEGNLSLFIIDTIKPNLSLKANNSVIINLNSEGKAILNSTDLIQVTNDNCNFTTSINPDTLDCSHIGNKWIYITITDESNNSTSDSILLSVEDNIAPTIQLQSTTFYINNQGIATVHANDLNNGTSDNCDNNFTFWLSDSIFGITDLGFNNVTFFAKNTKNEESSINTTILIKDTIPPVLTSSVKTVFLDTDGEVTVNPDIFNNGITDNSLIYSLSLSKTEFDCQDLDTNTLILTATDNYNNSSSIEVKLVIEDNIFPVVNTQNTIISINADGIAVLETTAIDNGSYDNCNLTFSLSDTFFNCDDLGVQNVYLYGTDQNYNTSTGITQVTVVDNSAPILLSKNIVAYLDNTGNIQIEANDVNDGSYDLCSDSLTLNLSKQNFNCADIGLNTISFSATDQQNNSISSTVSVTIADTVSPTVILQTNNLYLDSNGTLILNQNIVDNGSFDNCSSNLNFTFSDSVFSDDNLGSNTIEIYITDNYNNTTIINNYTFDILDTVAPIITDPIEDIIAYSQPNQCGTNVLFSAPTVEENTSDYTINYSQNSGSFFNIGENTVIYNVIDNQNNLATDSFKIHVIDTIMPFAVNTVSIYTQDSSNVVTWDSNQIVLTDNCTPLLEYTLSHNSGDTFPIGLTTVTISTEDASGNSATFTFPILVNDLIKPVFTSTQVDTTYYISDHNCTAQIHFDSLKVFDNSPFTVHYNITTDTILSVGEHNVIVTATDSFNNTTNTTFNIFVEDTIKPIFTDFPSDTIIGECNGVFNYTMPSGDDNCGVKAISLISGPASGSNLNIGIHNVLYKIIDNNDNETLKGFIVEVIENNEPFIIDNTLDCGTTDLIDYGSQNPNTSFFGKGINNNIFDPVNAGEGNHTIIWEYENEFGCTATDSFEVKVLPSPLKPIIQQVQLYVLKSHNSYASYQWYKNGNILNGETNSLLNISDGGNYELIVSNDVGCSAQSEIFNIGGGNHGSLFLENLNKHGFNITPNPIINQSKVSSKYSIDKQSVKLFNLLGKEQKIEINHLNNFQFIVNRTDQQAGIYILTFKSGSKLFSKKIIFS